MAEIEINEIREACLRLITGDSYGEVNKDCIGQHLLDLLDGGNVVMCVKEILEDLEAF